MKKLNLPLYNYSWQLVTYFGLTCITLIYFCIRAPTPGPASCGTECLQIQRGLGYACVFIHIGGSQDSLTLDTEGTSRLRDCTVSQCTVALLKDLHRLRRRHVISLKNQCRKRRLTIFPRRELRPLFLLLSRHLCPSPRSLILQYF